MHYFEHGELECNSSWSWWLNGDDDNDDDDDDCSRDSRLT